MSLKIITTLVIAFLLVLFGIFNNVHVEVNLFGIKNVSTLLSFFVFVVFLAGGIYAGFLSFSDQIKQSSIIRKLKKKIKNLKEALKEQEEHEQIPIDDSEEHSTETEGNNLESSFNSKEIDADLRLTPNQRKMALLKIKEQEEELKKKQVFDEK